MFRKNFLSCDLHTQVPGNAQMELLNTVVLDSLRRLRFAINVVGKVPKAGLVFAAVMRAAPSITKLEVQCASAMASAIEDDVAAALADLVHLKKVRFQVRA